VAPRTKSKLGLLILAYLAFVSLGLPDSVLGLAWPSIRSVFELPQAALGVPLAAGALSYFASGLLAGRSMQAVGVGGLLAVSTVLVAIAVFGQAFAPAFIVFVAAACLAGLGSGAVDAGLNSYGAQNFGARHMTWLHAAYSTGAALGSATLTALFAQRLSWRQGYTTIAVALSALAVAFVLTHKRWSTQPPRQREPDAAIDAAPSSEATHAGSAWTALRNPRVLLQSCIFFVYSGVEVGAGQWSYTILTQARGMQSESAGIYVTSYWATLLIGRILAGFIVEAVGTVKLLRAGCFVAAAGATLFAIRGLHPTSSWLGLCLVGLALAPIYPGLMSETPRRVGALSPHAVGFQVSAATAGVAVLPNLGGLVGEHFGLDAIAVFVAVCAGALLALHEVLVRYDDRIA
jgi:fucose permease